MTEAFKSGFLLKCAELGFDGSSLLKESQTNEFESVGATETGSSNNQYADVLTPEFFQALGQQESGNNDAAVNTNENAVGRYQIRQGYLDDANAFGGTDYTLEDMHNPTNAERVVSAYLARWAPRYTRRTGNPITQEVAARIHNGGYAGAERPSTTNYWNSVSNILSGITGFDAD